ncbi:oxygenase MpaB family protein [Gordonia sp. PKS22-38]|uniref:Oxygenase MpaB family protein n=1 Tax=Gordonia prachuapensis TaxID=3115651 RepID=A0ABU7MUV9_9ACTN|nr:oxygenase MpaB family protein [Gordonia sp. PKS22-38]
MTVVDHYQHEHVADVAPARRRRPVRRTGDLVTGLGPSIAGANVIMQLAHPKVGYGVVESRVESGSAMKHPIKRSRTTGTFLAVALFGTDEDKKFVNEELQRIHALVYSTEQSPVTYSGNDSRLQLWVAVCLTKYFIDQYELLYGPLSPAEKERVVADSRWLGTTLNVAPEQWPASYEAMQEYWDAQVPGMSIDPPVRDMLQQLSDLSFLEQRIGTAGALVHRYLGRQSKYLIKAGLPPEFRDMMHWQWSARDDRRLDRALDLARKLDPATGRLMRAIMSVYIVDLRLRRRLGVKVF